MKQDYKLYQFNKIWVLSDGYGYSRMQQTVHLLSGSGIGPPNDLWMPAVKDAPPSLSDQWSVGTSKTWDQKGIELSVELYYKQFRRLINFSPGSSFFSISGNNPWTDFIEKTEMAKHMARKPMFVKKKGNLPVGYSIH